MPQNSAERENALERLRRIREALQPVRESSAPVGSARAQRTQPINPMTPRNTFAQMIRRNAGSTNQWQLAIETLMIVSDAYWDEGVLKVENVVAGQNLMTLEVALQLLQHNTSFRPLPNFTRTCNLSILRAEGVEVTSEWNQFLRKLCSYYTQFGRSGYNILCAGFCLSQNVSIAPRDLRHSVDSFTKQWEAWLPELRSVHSYLNDIAQ